MRNMKEEEFKEFLDSQCEEIRKHLWIESEKAGKDLGDSAVFDWIEKNSQSYREWWEKTHTGS